MIKRTIEISRNPAHLSAKLNQLNLQPYDQPKSAAKSIPCEDIALLLVDHPQTTYTHHALTTLAQHGAAAVLCGRNHLPAALVIPLADHTESVWRINDQIGASKPLKKKLWQQIVTAKIHAQAQNLSPNAPAQKKLRVLAETTRSGDPENHEAQAARAYWPQWLQNHQPPSPATPAPTTPLKTHEARLALQHPDPFRRNHDADDPINAALNYGYAVLRAAVARALVAAGLFPPLGIHHHNRSNNFALADDLIEPLRPMIDRRVRTLHQQNHTALDQPAKALLLQTLHDPVRLDNTTGPLMVTLHRYAASLAQCYRGQRKTLLIPTEPPPPNPPMETDP